MIYLDNAATTKMSSGVIKAMEPYLSKNFGNPSGSYRIAKKSKEAIEHSREIIARSLNAKPENIYFTSGGSESNNWVLENMMNVKGQIITSSIEHKSILEKCAQLEQRGKKITRLNVNKEGSVIVSKLQDSIENETAIVSVMYGNNEIGTIQPIEKISEICKRNNVLFHTDAVQAYGHVVIDTKELKIDMLSASSHKFNGPKGVGFLYLKDSEKFKPLIYGGGQERALRAGTENVPGIVGMGQAALESMRNIYERQQYETRLRNYFINRVLSEIPRTRLNGSKSSRLPGNVSFMFEGILGKEVVRGLDKYEIFASIGSACSSCSKKPSYVIKAIGYNDTMALGTVRFSLNHNNTIEEINKTIYILKIIVHELRNN